MYIQKISHFIDVFTEYHTNNIPFIFLINFDISKFYIQKLYNLHSNKDILYDFNGITNFSAENNKKIDITFSKYTIDKEIYRRSFNKAFEYLINGDSYLINLTFPSRIETNLSFTDIFALSSAKYKFKMSDEFVFFSPESFISIVDGIVSTYPMKGTIVMESNDSAKKLLDDEKELAEHITVVDLLRNDLNMIAKNVEVERFRYIVEVERKGVKLLQTISKITGKLNDGKIAELFLKLLPAGSVTGAPKRRTLEIINEIEIDNRCFYTGVAGIFDGKSIDSCVIIRFIEKKNNQLFYRSGGGITVYSEINSEYKELQDKIYLPIL